jgi:hypothetical protein
MHSRVLCIPELKIVFGVTHDSLGSVRLPQVMNVVLYFLSHSSYRSILKPCGVAVLTVGVL